MIMDGALSSDFKYREVVWEDIIQVFIVDFRLKISSNFRIHSSLDNGFVLALYALNVLFW